MSPNNKNKSAKFDIVKLQIKGGSANPAPPVGTALGPRGINIMQFCKSFNDKTKDKAGILIPVIIKIAKDKSFTFEVKEPPMSVLIKQALSLSSGSKTPGSSVVGSIDDATVAKIAEQKMSDLNCYNLAEAKKMVIGTARSIGIEYNG